MDEKLYLLDSNIISEIIKPSPSFNVIQKIAEHYSECAISSITWHEMLFGVERLEEGLRKTELKKFLLEDVKESFEIISYDKNASQVHAILRSKLEKSGYPMPFADSQIASIAIANKMALVTRNTKDFEYVKEVCDLKMENWFEYVESRHANA